ncbi:MAG: inositol monophosphatase family protein [Microcoleaceae cyanobacterium]
MQPPYPTPKSILSTLLPHLRVAARYARQIQSRIQALPAKENETNLFATALSDADLAIQNLVEIALLGTFPETRFYGEEFQQSANTKYFRSTELGSPDGPQDDYLITLDPIDGTRFYLDGHDNYQIILGVLSPNYFEAVIAISPEINTYFYALRGEGAFYGDLSLDLEACQPLKISNPQSTILLSSRMGFLESGLSDCYKVISIERDYSAKTQILNYSGLFQGDVCGAILRSGKFIDGAALAFIAQEAGCLVTTLTGDPPPLLHTCPDLSWPGLAIAASETIQRDLLAAVQGADQTKLAATQENGDFRLRSSTQ